jgi:hypothetical protein
LTSDKSLYIALHKETTQMATLAPTLRFQNNLPNDYVLALRTKELDGDVITIHVDSAGKITTAINMRACAGFPDSSYVKARNLLNEVNRNLSDLLRVVKGINKTNGDHWQDNRPLYEDFMSLKAIFVLA